MSRYILINGKRHYCDDSGRISLDNVSEAEANRRASGLPPVSFTTNRPSMNSARTRTNSGSYSGRGSSSAITRTAEPSFGERYGYIFIILLVIAVIAFAVNRNKKAEPAEEYYYEETTVQEETVVYDLVDLLVWECSVRELESYELEGYSKEEMQTLINAIYAVHGRTFNSFDNQEYFANKDWYNPVADKSDEQIAAEFNKFEIKNIATIKEHF